MNLLIILGFFSLLCVVDCSGVNPCLNGGSCDTDACTCAAGFNGALCSTGMEIYGNARSVFSGQFFVFMKFCFKPH